jgi:predicted acylesterase/phospholipase RssA
MEDSVAAAAGAAAMPAAPAPGSGLRILCLDGGGIRGVFTLDVLRALEAACGGRRVIDCFDLIVGTSTGAFIAASLVAGRSIDAIEDEYWKVSVSFTTAAPSISSTIARAVRGHVIDPACMYGLLTGFLGDVRMEELPATPRLLLVGTDAAVATPQPFLIRSQRLAAEEAGRFAAPYTTDCALKDALAAVTAAPTYYPSFNLGGRTIVDGAVHSNNPVMYAIAEAATVFPGRGIDMLVSVGTGTVSADSTVAPPPSGLVGWANALIAVAQVSEPAGCLAAAMLGPSRYLRLSPTQVGDCGIWETDSRVLAGFRARVVVYLQSMQAELKNAARRLAR